MKQMWKCGCGVVVGMMVWLSGRVQGQTIYWLSDDRYVTVSGSAELPPGPPQNYSFTQTPDAPYSPFNGYVSGIADLSDTNGNGDSGFPRAHSDGHVSQVSSMDSSQISFSSSLWTATAGAGSGAVELCHAEAHSYFQVSFYVEDAVSYDLMVHHFVTPHGDGLPDFDFELSSANEGMIWSGYDTFGQSFSGVFMPGDVYTVLAFLDGSNHTPDPLGSDVILQFDATITLVPEPSSSLLLLAGLAGLGYQRRKR